MSKSLIFALLKSPQKTTFLCLSLMGKVPKGIGAGDLGGLKLKTVLGGYCDRVPPLPIPNREVKPVSVDGTAVMWESRKPPSFLKSSKKKIFFLELFCI